MTSEKQDQNPTGLPCVTPGSEAIRATDDVAELIRIAQYLATVKHWEAQAGSKVLAEIAQRLLKSSAGAGEQPVAWVARATGEGPRLWQEIEESKVATLRETGGYEIRQLCAAPASNPKEPVAPLQPKEGMLYIHMDDLIQADDYGVDGSTFYRCGLCGNESGAGMLNNGITHEYGCPLHPENIGQYIAAPASETAIKALQFYADGLKDDGSVANVALWAINAVAPPVLPDENLLVEFFRGEGHALGKFGDDCGWAPEQTAIQAMRELLRLNPSPALSQQDLQREPADTAPVQELPLPDHCEALAQAIEQLDDDADLHDRMGNNSTAESCRAIAYRLKQLGAALSSAAPQNPKDHVHVADKEKWPGSSLDVLIEVRQILQHINDNESAITDTLWYSDHETLFDYMDAAIEALQSGSPLPNTEEKQ